MALSSARNFDARASNFLPRYDSASPMRLKRRNKLIPLAIPLELNPAITHRFFLAEEMQYRWSIKTRWQITARGRVAGRFQFHSEDYVQ